MKHDRFVTAVLAGLLGMALGIGMAGCWSTAFTLPGSLAGPALVCAAVGAAWAALLMVRGGPALALGLSAAGLWLLVRRTAAVEQLLWLVHHISEFYDGAYGWGVLPLAEGAAAEAFWPLAVLGASLAAVTVWTVSRGLPAMTVLGPTVLVLTPCLVVTDTAPAARWLFPVFFAGVLVLLTAGVRAESAYQGNRLTLLAALPAALALGLLFLAAPHESYVNHAAQLRDRAIAWFQELPASLASGGEITLSGGEAAPRLDLAALGPRRDAAGVVMTVTADVGGTLYLRGQDYDVYDGRGWIASPNRVEELTCPGEDLGHVTIQTRRVLERLYLPYYPGGSRSLVGGRLENTVLASGYTFTRMGLPMDWREEALAAHATDGQWSGYLTLPASALPLTDLAASLTQGLDSATEKAEAIAAYVRGRVPYDKATPAMPQDREDFARWFLEEGERGYCVHFATATAVLLRAAGVPARYVSGYMVRAQAGLPVEVTGENAHAWAEYYESALGLWLVMESTPAQGTAETAQGAPATTSQVPTQETLTEPTTQPQTPQDIQPPQTRPQEEPEAPEEPTRTGLGRSITPLLALAAAAALILEQRRLRVKLRRLRQRRGSPNSQALARWQEAERLAALLKQAPPTELEELAQKAKFSQHTLTPEELARFDAWSRAARRSLGQRPWYRRLVYRYIYAIE